MNQAIKKMIIAGLAVVLSVALIVTATYAWTVLSATPTVENIQITIGGGNTILLAPNISQEIDGEICHYPGYFDDTLIFSRYDSYDYLQELDSLLPVSTADGINWFTPAYYDVTDPEVKNGDASVGDVKPLKHFNNDRELLMANLPNGSSQAGHYIYLDFWVVSPGTSYTLRVARGDQNGGSHLIELPKVKEREDGFVLEETDNTFAASARVGFLATSYFAPKNHYTAYQNSRYYNSSYGNLAGLYHEKGNYPYSDDYRFTIYEPNGFLNPEAQEIRYSQTRPVGFVNEKPALIDVRDRLTVQLENSWTKDANSISLQSILNTAIAGKDVKTPEDAETILYNNYLQGQFSPYLTRGKFVTRTAELYDACDEKGTANEEQLIGIDTSGATEDVYIVRLEKNIPQRIRMFVWIEGQDVDCSQMSESARFALSLELAGSN